MPLLGKETVTIPLTVEGEWVRVKRYLTRSDRNHIRGMAIDLRLVIDGDGNASLPDGLGLSSGDVLDSLDFGVLERAIVEWCFPEPVTPETIRMLTEADVDLLKAECGRLYDASAPTPDERKNADGPGRSGR